MEQISRELTEGRVDEFGVSDTENEQLELDEIMNYETETKNITQDWKKWKNIEDNDFKRLPI